MDEEERKKAALRALAEASRELDELRMLNEQRQLDKNLNITAEPPLCSFCGRGKNQVRRMIEGNNAYICSECIKACQDLINEP